MALELLVVPDRLADAVELLPVVEHVVDGDPAGRGGGGEGLEEAGVGELEEGDPLQPLEGGGQRLGAAGHDVDRDLHDPLLQPVLRAPFVVPPAPVDEDHRHAARARARASWVGRCPSLSRSWVPEKIATTRPAPPARTRASKWRRSARGSGASAAGRRPGRPPSPLPGGLGPCRIAGAEQLADGAPAEPVDLAAAGPLGEDAAHQAPEARDEAIGERALDGGQPAVEVAPLGEDQVALLAQGRALAVERLEPLGELPLLGRRGPRPRRALPADAPPAPAPPLGLPFALLAGGELGVALVEQEPAADLPLGGVGAQPGEGALDLEEPGPQGGIVGGRVSFMTSLSRGRKVRRRSSQRVRQRSIPNPWTVASPCRARRSRSSGSRISRSTAPRRAPASGSISRPL